MIAWRFEDLTGQTFGLLKVIKRADTTHDECGTSRVNWFVECECSAFFITKARYLKRGSKTTCGKQLCKMRLARRENETAKTI